jgi:hypothetical protein
MHLGLSLLTGATASEGTAIRSRFWRAMEKLTTKPLPAVWQSGSGVIASSSREVVTSKIMHAYTRVFSHALFFCGHLVWHKVMVLSGNRYFDPMLRLAETDMRLICLDVTKTSIGWATNQARLRDEVFLIVRCNRPVILRKNQEGRYTVVGEALVFEAWNGSMWNDNTGGRGRNTMTVKIV